MGTFTTKLSLGEKAYVVGSGLDPIIMEMTVGQIRVKQTHPKHRESDESTCYEEVYMCVESGVGSGSLWTYGVSIFKTHEEAEHGANRLRQQNYKQLAEREKRRKEQNEWKRKRDLETLEELKAKYGG